MIQDIAPYIYDNAYQPRLPEGSDYVLYYEGNKVLAEKRSADSFQPIEFQTLSAELQEQIREEEAWTYLFTIDGCAYYLLKSETADALKVQDDYELVSIRYFTGREPKHQGFAVVTGYQLAGWYNSRKFCGRCGSPMIHDETERMMRCETCGLTEYPKISPGVIIAVTNGDKLLLSKYVDREYKRYALLAGFTEIGETLEETVKREVMEEVGLKVTNIRYYKGQPWSISSSLLLGFFCDLAEEDDIRLDTTELAIAEWFAREEIPVEYDGGISLTNEMILRFKNGEA